MHSTSAEVGRREIHFCRETSWKKTLSHYFVTALKDIDKTAIEIDPYCCKITIDVTQLNIFLGKSEYLLSFFSQEECSMMGTVAHMVLRFKEW